MVEIYFEIGMTNEAKNTASVLGHNYPKSKWYKYSYDLVTEKENNSSFIGKLKNFLICPKKRMKKKLVKNLKNYQN